MCSLSYALCVANCVVAYWYCETPPKVNAPNNREPVELLAKF